MNNKLTKILAAILISVFSTVTISEAETMKKEGAQKSNSMKIHLRFKDKTVTGTLVDNRTTRDFVSLLPLTLNMDDLFRREKFARLPKPISTEGERKYTYEVGEIIYWSPGPDVAIYYRQDGGSIPSPGIIRIGKIDAGIEAFDMPGSVKVTIEIAK